MAAKAKTKEARSTRSIGEGRSLPSLRHPKDGDGAADSDEKVCFACSKRLASIPAKLNKKATRASAQDHTDSRIDSAIDLASPPPSSLPISTIRHPPSPSPSQLPYLAGHLKSSRRTVAGQTHACAFTLLLRRA